VPPDLRRTDRRTLGSLQATVDTWLQEAEELMGDVRNAPEPGTWWNIMDRMKDGKTSAQKGLGRLKRRLRELTENTPITDGVPGPQPTSAGVPGPERPRSA
jgi:hypothetical protein